MSSADAAGLTPVTVIGGYLGAGKTTVVNRLLRGGHGCRLAVLVNDFGSVNVDAALIQRHDGETMQLANGCVCCSISDALGDAIDRVLSLPRPPEQIVIEASGVADPANIASYGQGWPGCRLDAVVVLADAETIRKRARDDFVGELVVRQLRRADLVLLTKVDLVDTTTGRAVADWIDQQAQGVRVVPVAHGDVDPVALLDLDAGGRAVTSAAAVSVEQFRSSVIEFGDPAERSRVEEVLRSFPEHVVRAKGLFRLRGEFGLYAAQCVGRRWSIEPAPGAAPDAAVLGRLVVIEIAA